MNLPDKSKTIQMGTGFICLSIVADSLGIKIDKNKIPAELKSAVDEANLNENSIIKLAEYFKINLEAVTTEAELLPEYHSPSIAVLNDGHFVVIGRCDGKWAVIFDPLINKPKVTKNEALIEIWSGRLIFAKVAPRKKSLIGEGWRLGFKWFLPIIKKYRQFLYEVALVAFFLQLFGLVTPLFTQVIIDKAIPNKGEVTLTALAVVFLIAIIFQAGLNIAKTYLLTQTTNKIDVVLGSKLIRHVVSLPLRYFELRWVGDILMRISALNSIREFFTGKTLILIIDALFSFVFLSVLLYYSPYLTLIALIPVPIYLFQNIKLMPIYRTKLERVWQADSQSNSFLVEAVTGMQTIKSLAVEPQFAYRWEHYLANSVKNNFSLASFSLINNNLTNVVQKVTGFLVLLFGGRMVIEGSFSLGQLIAFQMISGQLISNLTQIIGAWPEVQQTGMALERLGDILETRSESANSEDSTPKAIKGDITFQDVRFRYNFDGDEVIKGLSFRIKPGTKVGIVGRSGSGKSTIAKMIQRLYLPEDGKIIIDGQDILAVDPVLLRRQIGVVMQDNYLFSGSIRENIALARPDADMNIVVQSARIAGAHEFILELSEGYDTKVGERGCNLSGGQRQRIAIARALMNQPRLLIFDEATSALDYQSERLIIDNIDQICLGRTAVIIAHRLSAVRRCDQIIVLDQGQIVEIGNHKELMKLQGQYHALYKLQEVN
ncbi:MAG: peptidase domain-containing ABC transporter [Lentisphaerota bacterium]